MNPAQSIIEVILQKLPGALFQQAFGFIEQAWPILLLLFVLSRIGRFFRSAKGKGYLGEAVVGLAVLRRLDSRLYRVFHDLYLPRPDGKGTTQIDHVVVSRYGIFVIETKNMTGWIFGDANSRQWTQSIYSKKQRFQNPLHQNALHVNALARLLELPAICLHNLVFFVGDATLKTDLPANVMTRGLRSFIEAWQDEVIASRDLSRVIERLEAVEAGTNRKTAHREHVLQLKGR